MKLKIINYSNSLILKNKDLKNTLSKKEINIRMILLAII